MIVLAVMAGPPGTLAAEPAAVEVTAFLDGRPIPIADVSRYRCDDFAYPEVHCSSIAQVSDSRAQLAAAAGIEYVTIYDYTNYQGGWMRVSEDYGSFMTIGWNDRVSSFKGRNSETGTFWTDWFSGGSSWSFCCNTQQASLGAYNNTFSSIQRT